MARPAQRTFVERLSEMPLAKVAAYYVILVAGSVLTARLFPGFGAFFSSDRMHDLVRGGGDFSRSPFTIPEVPGPTGTLEI
ncbi:MAG TPA: hypothetical protein VFO95_17975, partial [Gemmatimonadales bacterium]|nr:hypothetical protein [Gemmatimonadales bacterium]